MNINRILFDYIVSHERYKDFPSLRRAEEKLTESLSDEQKSLFEKYNDEYGKYYNDRIYYYFCKGIEAMKKT